MMMAFAYFSSYCYHKRSSLYKVGKVSKRLAVNIPKRAFHWQSCLPESSQQQEEEPFQEQQAKPGWTKKFLSLLGYDGVQMNPKQVLKTYGIAAILSYGIFDAVTYSLSFLIALIGFIRTTGKTLTWKTFPVVFGVMWGINNFSRPFRVAGALLLAPFMDKYVVQPLKKRFSA